MTLANRLALTISLLAFSVLLLPAVAHAQSASAEALFREGRALIKQGKLAEGCAKIEASNKLDPSVGTLLNLGDCKEKQGKVATAWAAFREAEAMAKRAGNDRKRMAEARRRAQKLEPQLANLEIDVARPAEGLAITRNGDPVDAAVWNTGVPIDPGTYTITAQAPGHKPWKSDIVVASRSHRQITVPALDPEPVAERPQASGLRPQEEPTPPPATVVVTRPEAGSRTPEAPSPWTGMRKTSVGLLAVGVVAVGAGAYFGVHAKSLESDADTICPMSTCSDSHALQLNRDARDSASRANIAFAVGGVAAATAGVLWLLGGPDEHAQITPAIGNGELGATYTGRF